MIAAFCTFSFAKVTAVTALPRSLASPAAAPPERADRGRKQMPVPDVTLGCEMWVWYLKNPGNKKPQNPVVWNSMKCILDSRLPGFLY